MKALIVSALLLVGAPAVAQISQPTIAVNGTVLNVSTTSEVSHAPDVAQFSVGVITQASDSNSAVRSNAQQMEQVVAAVRQAGVNERDIQTSGLHVSPQYHFQDNQPPKITGYQASNTVNIKVRDIKRVGTILDAAASQGANQINGPTFTIDQPEPLYDQARRQALQKAQDRAQLYAHALGLRIVRVISIDENTSGGLRPVMMQAAAPRMAMDASTPVSPGESTVSVSLNVVFELGR